MEEEHSMEEGHSMESKHSVEEGCSMGKEQPIKTNRTGE